jgi:hypothetical protein
MRPRLVPSLFLLLILAAPAPAQEAPESNLLTVGQFLNLETVAGPQLSPDGAQIVYTRRWVNAMEDRWASALWIMNADGRSSSVGWMRKAPSPRSPE